MYLVGFTRKRLCLL